MVFAGISFLGDLVSDDSSEDYSHKNVVPQDYDDVGATEDNDVEEYNEDYNTGDEDELSSTEGDSSDESTSSYQATYVGSVNSDKFHDPSCSQAKRIKDGNMITFSSRDDAINSGYSPCGICHP